MTDYFRQLFTIVPSPSSSSIQQFKIQNQNTDLWIHFFPSWISTSRIQPVSILLGIHDKNTVDLISSFDWKLNFRCKNGIFTVPGNYLDADIEQSSIIKGTAPLICSHVKPQIMEGKVSLQPTASWIFWRFPPPPPCPSLKVNKYTFARIHNTLIFCETFDGKTVVAENIFWTDLFFIITT